MMDNIIDLILEIRERSTCFDHSKTGYITMVRGLTNEGCKFHEHLFTPEDIENFLEKHLDAKNELIIHLSEFMNLIEQLDAELRTKRGDDL